MQQPRAQTQRLGAWPTTCSLVLVTLWCLVLPSLAGAESTWGTSSSAKGHKLPRDALSVVNEHPRLFASGDQWNGLGAQIAKNDYLRQWNETIIDQANELYSEPVIPYPDDCNVSVGCTLEVARYIQLRVKHWAYAYILTNDVKYVNRTWEELQHAAGNGTEYFGRPGDNWNSRHFLDTAEFTAAFAYAYDWLYDAWTPAQRDALMWSIIELGLQKGIDCFADQGVGWWTVVRGNWNCTFNGGLLLGALAIYNEDPTGTAAQILPDTIANSQEYCAHAISSDGTWLETPDYWYFGIQSFAQIAAALTSATGSDQGTLAANPAVNLTGLFRIYSQGMVDKFNYGDCGPEKITATANPLMFFGKHLGKPRWTKYQRDQDDAADPLSMFWYDTDTPSGEWSDGLELDHYFSYVNTSWASMRSSWTDDDGLYVAMKASTLMGHQTHGDLDAGDFVLDAMGERWAGDLCQNDYNGPGYFASENQDSPRWLYYRCGTIGQNTLLYNGSNQLVNGIPVTTFNSTGLSSTTNSSTAFYIADLTSFYEATSIKRGIRLLDGRKRVLIQDEIVNAGESSQWRVHTNATVELINNSTQALLTLNGKTVVAEITSPGDLVFTTMEAVRLPDSPPLPVNGTDLPNTGVTVLAIDIAPGTQTVSVVFTPHWSDYTPNNTTKQIPLSAWNLTSHDTLDTTTAAHNSSSKSGNNSGSLSSSDGSDSQNGTSTNNSTDGSAKNSATRPLESQFSTTMSVLVFTALTAAGVYLL
ncbi:hypothetical protein PV08_08192 [Exophiala spinifera]|uniref:Heparinase II/III-like C-terminal domain-containing protein n=1 Tax=Exophiala spinifera TaxID=91928 RepID=A0A0D2B354_9EURO|nr:uncharacterized protein PV08_08192 [Exophiala spinifera]KIW13005.1 hypothetical protein PV08_08192 [Exophiala spinifera]